MVAYSPGGHVTNEIYRRKAIVQHLRAGVSKDTFCGIFFFPEAWVNKPVIQIEVSMVLDVTAKFDGWSRSYFWLSEGSE